MDFDQKKSIEDVQGSVGNKSIPSLKTQNIVNSVANITPREMLIDRKEGGLVTGQSSNEKIGITDQD